MNRIFDDIVGRSEEEVSAELYMSKNDLISLHERGFSIGSHTASHMWLNSLSAEEQKTEIKNSLDTLKYLIKDISDWIMCYPYGIFNNSLIDILKNKNCSMAFTTKKNLTALTIDNAYTLERLDTNEFPKSMDEKPKEWVQMIMNS